MARQCAHGGCHLPQAHLLWRMLCARSCPHSESSAAGCALRWRLSSGSWSRSAGEAALPLLGCTCLVPLCLVLCTACALHMPHLVLLAAAALGVSAECRGCSVRHADMLAFLSVCDCSWSCLLQHVGRQG